MSIRVTISGIKQLPTWATLDSLLRESTGNEHGKLVRIARQSPGCDYGAVGDYACEFMTDDKDIINVRVVAQVLATRAFY